MDAPVIWVKKLNEIITQYIEENGNNPNRWGTQVKNFRDNILNDPSKLNNFTEIRQEVSALITNCTHALRKKTPDATTAYNLFASLVDTTCYTLESLSLKKTPDLTQRLNNFLTQLPNDEIYKQYLQTQSEEMVNNEKQEQPPSPPSPLTAKLKEINNEFDALYNSNEAVEIESDTEEETQQGENSKTTLKISSFSSQQQLQSMATSPLGVPSKTYIPTLNPLSPKIHREWEEFKQNKEKNTPNSRIESLRQGGTNGITTILNPMVRRFSLGRNHPTYRKP